MKMKKIRWCFIAATLGLAAVIGMVLTMNASSQQVQAQMVPEQPPASLAQASAHWVTETIDSGGDADSHWSSLALDSTDTPYVAYHVASQDSLRSAVLSGSVWISHAIEASALSPSLVVDSSQTPRVAYTHRGPHVNYASWDGAAWVTETVEGPLTAGAALALDSSGDPHVAYWNVGPPFMGGGFRYAAWNGSAWQAEEIEEFFTPEASSPALALDSLDRPHVAYVVAAEDSLRYATFDGAAWVTHTVAISAASASLALDGADRPHVAYTHRGPYVDYAFWNGTGWVTETVDAEMAAGPALVLDAYGNPHVAYCDVRPVPPGAGLKYAYRTPDGWVIQTVDHVACQDPALALDGWGNPHVSYYDAAGDRIQYAHWVTPQTTGTVGTGGGGLTSPEDQSTYTFPPDTFTGTVVITHTPLFPGSVPPSGSLTGIGHAFDVAAVYSGTGSAAQPAPGKTYTITVQYAEGETGLVDEETLALYYWDGGQWVEEPTSQVDTVANSVTATPDHFSIWAVLGEIRSVFLPFVLR